MTWRHALVLGQSNAVGQDADPALVLARPANAKQIDDAGVLSSVTALDDKERPGLALAAALAAGFPSDTIVESTHALGGQTIQQLSRGGSSGKWEESAARVAVAATAAATASQEYEIAGLFLIQGEANQGVNNLDLSAIAFERYQPRYVLPLGEAAGEVRRLPLIYGQVASWWAYMSSTLGAPTFGLTQMAAHRDYPHYWCFGGMYQFPFSPTGIDNPHYTNLGCHYIGEHLARAHFALRATGTWDPLRVRSITRSGNDIDVRLWVPVPPVKFDTTLVAAQTHQGFTLAGTAAAITGVSVLSADTIRITTDVAMSEGGATVRYGYAALGLGNVCDSETAESIADDRVLANWLVHFNEEVGVSYPAKAAQDYTSAPPAIPPGRFDPAIRLGGNVRGLVPA